jgi:hypothetical protein
MLTVALMLKSLSWCPIAKADGQEGLETSGMGDRGAWEMEGLGNMENREALLRRSVTPSPLSSVASLPCSDSSPECIDRLVRSAIDRSPKLKLLDDRIALVNQRLEIAAQRIDYAEDKSWTNYITTDPVKLIQNIFGGGDVQKDEIEIANLELKSAELEAMKIELERQKEEEKIRLSEKVLQLVLDYEEAGRTIALIESQSETFKLQNEVFRIQYRLGEGSTEQLLSIETRGEKLREQLTLSIGKRDEVWRELLDLVGDEKK